MVRVQRIDDATYLVTDPRFTHQPAPEFPSGYRLPDPEKLVGGPLAMFALAGIAWRLLLRNCALGRR